jgi:superfamily II DNA helicase RecQ
VSFISSNTKVSKRIKTSSLIELSSSSFENSSSILLSLLREFLQDNTSVFRCLEQELLIKSILLKIPYILGVLPTSSGKSLSYLLTSSLSISKVTIVIIPLIGLKQDILRRAKEFNIPCNIYEDEQEFKSLTLISIESIISSTFIAKSKELIKSNSLDRIIVDEYHLLLSSSSYRNIMFRFKEILLLNT